jgi:hypothetical protein
MDKTTLSALLKIGATLAGVAFASSFSFSPRTKKYLCENWTDRNILPQRYDLIPNEPMRWSHTNHRKDRGYDDPCRAVYCTLTQEYTYHLLFKDDPSLIGLTIADNNLSIRTLKEECLDFYHHSNLSERDLVKNVQCEKANWAQYIRTYININES